MRKGDEQLWALALYWFAGPLELVPLCFETVSERAG